MVQMKYLQVCVSVGILSDAMGCNFCLNILFNDVFTTSISMFS